MTRISPTLYPDRTDGNKVATHQERFRSEHAQPVSSVDGNEFGRATESDPLTSSSGGHSQGFQSVFADLNEEQIEFDQLDDRSTAEKILHGISLFCVAVIAFCLFSLLYVNLISPASVPGEYDPGGCHTCLTLPAGIGQ